MTAPREQLTVEQIEEIGNLAGVAAMLVESNKSAAWGEYREATRPEVIIALCDAALRASSLPDADGAVAWLIEWDRPDSLDRKRIVSFCKCSENDGKNIPLYTHPASASGGSDPLEMKLTGDVRIGHMIFGKGVHLRTLVLYTQRLQDEYKKLPPQFDVAKIQELIGDPRRATTIPFIKDAAFFERQAAMKAEKPPSPEK